MFAEQEETGFQYEYDAERDFRQWKCKMCKHYSECPSSWKCNAMIEFIERENKYENLDDDNSY